MCVDSVCVRRPLCVRGGTLTMLWGLLEFGEDCACILPIGATYGAAIGVGRAEVAVRVDRCRGER